MRQQKSHAEMASTQYTALKPRPKYTKGWATAVRGGV